MKDRWQIKLMDMSLVNSGVGTDTVEAWCSVASHGSQELY